MNRIEKNQLQAILEGNPFQVRPRLDVFLKEVAIEEERTSAQNRALHKWFAEVAKTCNDNSVDAKLVMSKVVRMNMTPSFIKEMWRALQQALFQKKSTKQLGKTGEIDVIRDHFIRFFADEFELELPPFPTEVSRET